MLKTDLQLNPAKVLNFRFLELKMNILSISSMFACLVLPGNFLVFHKNTNVRHLSRMNDLIEAICSTCFGLSVILASLSYLRSLISTLGHILYEITSDKVLPFRIGILSVLYDLNIYWPTTPSGFPELTNV